MATKKKTSNATSRKKKSTKKEIEKAEKNLEKIVESIEKEEEIDYKKQAIKEDLQKQLITQGKFGKQFDDMVENYLYLVELKERLKYDIDNNGIRYKVTGGNGFTTYKPNESCERILKTNAEMRKILQDLDLKSPEPNGDGDDENDLL